MKLDPGSRWRIVNTVRMVVKVSDGTVHWKYAMPRRTQWGRVYTCSVSRFEAWAVKAERLPVIPCLRCLDNDFNCIACHGAGSIVARASVTRGLVAAAQAFGGD